MATDGTIDVSTHRGIAHVTLNRPPVNSFNLAFYDELRRTFHRLADDDSLRVVVLTGSGRVFCAGNDVNDFVDLDFETSVEYLARVRLAFNSVYDCPVPVIGAINGAAVGTGIALASVCDFRVGSERAKFALPEIDVGVLGGSKHVMRIATQGMTRMMMYTGRRLTAEEAQQVGIVDICVSEEDLSRTVGEIAEEIARKSPTAIRLAKQGLNRVEGMSLKEGYEYECTLTAAVRRTANAREGALAFLEKREPSYAEAR